LTFVASRNMEVFPSALSVATTILTAECTAYWQIVLCQGFGFGVLSHLAAPTTRDDAEPGYVYFLFSCLAVLYIVLHWSLWGNGGESDSRLQWESLQWVLLSLVPSFLSLLATCSRSSGTVDHFFLSLGHFIDEKTFNG
jgi:hypothetical protein